MALRLGIYDHLGWAVAVTVSADYEVVDRRRIELVEAGVPKMPVHHPGHGLDVEAVRALAARVRASAERMTSAALDDLAAGLPAPIVSMSLRALPADFPSDVAVQLRPPYEARADAIMYREVLVEAARDRGWAVLFYKAKAVEAEAQALLARRADDVLRGPRTRIGPPWTKDHRTALAATILAGDT